MQRDEIDIAFDEVHREEVTADIEVQTAVSEPGVVEDGDRRYEEAVMLRADPWAVGSILKGAHREQLDERLDAIESAGM